MKTKDCLKKLSPPTVHKRKDVKRKLIKAVRGENVRQAIGDLYPRCEIYGFTKGQFSLIDIIEHCLDQIGPSDVALCTWSASAEHIRATNRMLSQSKIKTLKFIVDFSFPRRKPEDCQALLDAFGADCIRVSSVHAKFATFKAEGYSLVVRTSMNLNHNPRFESFEISDDPALFAFMTEIVDEVWQTQENLEGLTNRPSDNQRAFAKMYATGELTPVDGKDLIPGGF